MSGGVVFAGDTSRAHREDTSSSLTMITALIAVVTLVGALLAPAGNISIISTGELATAASDLFDSPPISTEEQALRDQIEAVGAGLSLGDSIGMIDAAFMLAGPAFSQGDANFSIATSSYQGDAVAAVVPTLDGERIIYERGDVTEWWQQTGSSYEQGWTVAAAPADGSTDLSLLVGFGNAAPLAESDTTVRLLLSDNSIVWYRDLFAFDADGTTLPATMTVDGSNVRIDVDAAGAAYPVTIDPIITNSEKIVPPLSTAGDRMGEAVATDGDLMIVSVSGADEASIGNGRAEIYTWSGSDWTFASELLNQSIGGTDFGWDVDINETAGVAVVGSPADDVNGANAGAAHIYTESGGSWSFAQTIFMCDPTGGACGDSAPTGFDFAEFGKSVAVGDTGSVLVGAPGAGSSEGTAYVYDSIGVGGEWLTNADRVIKPEAQGADDRFGTAVDITADGLIALVGAPLEDFGGFTDRGRLYSYVLDAGVWGDGDGALSDGGDGLEFTSSVAIGTATNGTIIAVAGAPWRSREDQDGVTGFPGRARVFTVDAAGLLSNITFGNLSSPVSDDGFGFSVAFDDALNRVIVGSPFNNGAVPDLERGLVSVFEYDPVGNQMVDTGGGVGADPLALPSDWSGLATGNDNYGFSVAAGPSGTYVVGSPGETNTTPRVSTRSGRVTTTAPSATSVHMTPNTQTAAAFDRAGYSVTVSGNRMAVGAINDDATADARGGVLTYERAAEGDPWTFESVLTYPVAATDLSGLYGHAVDMKGDFLVVGSPGGDGRMDVYQHSGASWALRGSASGNPADNISGLLDFGFDVGITDDGRFVSVGVPGHDNSCGGFNCGQIEIYEWNGVSYVLQTEYAENHGEEDDQRYGTSVDIDYATSVGGSPLVRAIAGSLNVVSSGNTGAVDSLLITPSVTAPSPAAVLEATIASTADIGESVALDGDRLVAAAASGVSDLAIVADINPGDTAWTVQTLTTADLGDSSLPTPNGFIDVAGDFVAVGRDGLSGEVAVFYNDPVYGWGFPNDIGGVGGPLWSDGPLDQIQPSSGAAGDDIGRAVAIDREIATYTVLAGAPNDDDAGDTAGAAYSTSFVEPVIDPIANKITVGALDQFGDDRLGYSISVDGDWAVVGEPGQDGDTNQGRAHVLQNVAGDWSIVQTLTRSTVAPSTSDRFGWDVALDGDFFVVASKSDGFLTSFERSSELAPFVEAAAVSPAASVDAVALFDGIVGVSSITSGTVYFYRVGENALVPTWNAVSPDPQIADLYGFSLVIGGTPENAGGCAYAAVGAPKHDTVGGGDFGEVYIYPDLCDDVLQISSQTVQGPVSGTDFGSALAADNLRLVIGHEGAIVPVFGGPAQSAAGTAYVYDYDSSDKEVTLDQQLESVDFTDHIDESDGYGSAVDIDGDIVVVGSASANERDVPWRAGAAYTWAFDGGAWTEQDTFRADDDANDDRFGFAVAISGSEALVGAPDDDNAQGRDSGAVYSFVASTPADNPTLAFDINLGPGEPTSVPVAPVGIAVSDFDAGLLSDASDDGTSIAASSFSETDIENSPLSGIELGSTPLSGILLDDTSSFYNIPVVEVNIDGGWPELLESTGSALAGLPLTDVTLGEVASDAAAGPTLLSTPLSGIEVDGTPLSGIPLSGILLGGLPLSGISTDVPWCTILAPYLGGSCDPNTTTLLDATLSGIPLSGIPLSGIPLSGIVLSGTPLSGIDVGELELQNSPLSGIPLSGIDIGNTPLSGIPLSGIDVDGLPLSGITLNGTPLSGIPLSGIDVGALQLSGLELRNVPLSGIPLSGIDVGSLPLAQLPLSGIALADVPLSGIPLSGIGTDWCTLLSELASDYDCSFGVDETTFLANTTIADLGLRGVAIGELPLSGIPLSGITIGAVPLSGITLDGIPLSGIPLSGIPLSGIELVGSDLETAAGGLASLPLSGIHLSGIDVQGSPLSGIPLSGIDLSNLPLSGIDVSASPLSGIPLSGIPILGAPLSGILVNGSPLSGIPLSGIDINGSPLSGIPLSGIDVTGAPLSGIGVDCTLVDCEIDTLGDAILAGAFDPTSKSLLDLQPFLAGLRLGDIADALNDSTREDLVAALVASGLLIGSLTDLDDMTLGDLPASLVEDVLLGDLNTSLWAVTYRDLVGAIIDPTTGAPFSDTDVANLLESYLSTFTFGNFAYFGDGTFGDLLLADNAGDFDLGDLGPILGLIHLTDLIDLTDFAAQAGSLGSVTEEQLGDLTLLDLFGQGFTSFDELTVDALLAQADLVGELYGYDIADLFLALVGVDPAAFNGLDFTEVESGQLPEDLIPAVTFVANFEVRDTTNQKTVDVTAQLPATASYVPGSASVTDETPLPDEFSGDPVVSGNTLTWTVTGVTPDDVVFVAFDVKPTVTIGSTNISATATIAGTDATGSGSAAISVTEGIEPNDFPVTTPASIDTVYLTYISSEADNDVFSITIGDNDQLAIQLSSLTADLDVALYGNPTNDAVGSALTNESEESPLEPITDPDQEGANTEPLNDFRRLDDEDANLNFIELSNSPGTETELLVTDALPAGTYYVQVFGANGATNVEPAALQIQVLGGDARPACSANGAITGGNIGSFPALAGSTANTLILTNEQRTENLYPGEWTDLDTEINDLVAYLNVNPQLGIDPVVVSVDGNGIVQGAYSTWDTDSGCSPESANGVVEAIISQAIEPLRDTLEHVVIIGGDQVIPMARLLDATEIANEYDFRHEFIGDNALGVDTNINALSASFWDRQYLSDEPYGESAARSLGNRFLYVSDIALGRMVETPAEIQASLQHFQDFDGALEADTAAILGYDFLVDSSEEIAADLESVLGAANVDSELADGLDGAAKWDAADAEDKIIPAGGAPDLISFNAHFDHYRALPADGDQVPNFNNNFLASTVANATPGLLQGSIVFSMGCHGGLSVSDLQIDGGAVDKDGDWAQTFAADQAIFVGNTGFGYGDTEAVAYTEKLMALFAEQAVRPIQIPGQTGSTTIGQALTFAKNEYASDLSVFSVYDEKALMESTFYGLPFYRVEAPVVPADAIPTNTTAPDSTGNESLTLTADTTNAPESTALGTIYSNPDESGKPQVIIAPGMPVQPSQSFDVSVVDGGDSTQLGTVARGALVLDMVSTYNAPVDPVVSSAIFNESESQPEPELGDVVFPAKPVTLNTVTRPGGERQKLALATGQFDSDGSVQRLDDEIDVVIYYADATDIDFMAPTIGAVESTLATTGSGAELTVTLSATDDGEVSRVYLLVAADPGTGTVDWVGVDLVQAAGTDEWSGSVLLPPGTTNAEFLVQVVDGSGNVGFATNKARNFDDDGTVVVDPPAPDLDVTVSQANFDVPSGWYTGSVELTVVSGDQPATYLIQPGGIETTVPVGGVFTVDGDGVNSVTVSRSDGQFVTNTIRIDTQAPVASIAPPEVGAIFFQSDVPNVGFVCQDPSLASCVASVDGNPIENADPLPSTLGPHTVSVTATDALNNSVTEMAGYVVDPDPVLGDPPTITDVEIDGVALPGEPVDIFGEFEDGVGPFIMTVDWGNGDVCPSDGSCMAQPPDGVMPGTFEASYTYPVGGSYTVEVTITDANGASATMTLTTATCTITGTNGNNYINGTSRDDVICGLGGKDRINGRGGADVIFGGTGDDVLRGGNGADEIYGGRGADVLLGQDGTDSLFGGRGADLLSGGPRNDVMKGRRGADVLIGGSGMDLMFGNRGHDQLYGGGGIDDLRGGRGNDFISGSFGADTISGGSGGDTVFGGYGGDMITSGFGEDWVSGGPGNDNIDGGGDDDDLRGDWGNDTIEGGDGFDRCRGGVGTDTLTGCES